MFHVSNIMFLVLYTLQHAYHQNFSFYTVNFLYPLFPPCCPFPSDKGYSVLWISVFAFVWFVHWLWSFSLLYIPYKSEIIWYVSFSIWLSSLSIIPSRSTCVVRAGRIFIFFMAQEYSIVYGYHIFFLHSCDGHLNCFLILTTVNNASVNIGAHISFQISVFVSLG